MNGIAPTMPEDRFPDDRPDNERFTGSAAGWIGAIFIVVSITIVILVIVLAR